ncbi:phosphocarrier protein HPr [Anaerobacillus alkalilacustris]|uniref:Phosphocarrier protein HPr n=1 Tax=Anaerobacillus alkalilacustris TaxID=393763 RepID=A0A1S2LLL4_9BACI|nr:phosphocarrier protein HPr [Anaerobacillus alkalilacustris]OIJ12567.1 phosphocarrier protein HPr [Anaerobacillus alkalilacustris]
MVEKNFIITDETGIHARPATQLVNAANQFSSEISLIYSDKTVNLKSIMGVMSLGIPQDAQITIQVKGTDEVEALSGITAVIKDGLGE